MPTRVYKLCRKQLHPMTFKNVYARPDGRGLECRACRAVSSKKHTAWLAEHHPEILKAQRLASRDTPAARARRLVRQREAYWANPEKYRARQRRYVKEQKRLTRIVEREERAARHRVIVEEYRLGYEVEVITHHVGMKVPAVLKVVERKGARRPK